MKRTAPLLILLALCLAAISNIALAQSYLNATGNPSFSVNIPVENGFINVANGNLHLEFPLAAHKQRGALALNERLVYDSRIWDIVHYSGYYWWPTNIPNTPYGQGGWRFVVGNETGTLGLAPSSSSNSLTCLAPPKRYLTENTGWNVYNWTDPNGTVHTFDAVWGWDQSPAACGNGNPTNQTVAGYATDASGYFINMTGLTSSRNPTISIVDSSGTQVYPQVADRYGNYWSTDPNGNLIDDVGRTPVLITQNGSVTYYDVLAPNGPINNNGTRVRYTVTTVPVQISTNFNQPPSGTVTEWTGTVNPVQSIQLPDGSSYTFTYDSYGEMTSVTLPTGGVISYGWGNYLDSYQNENRWLYSRTMGNSPPTTFAPAVLTQCSGNGTGCQEQVTLHQPSGDETVYQLTLNNGAWNTNVTAYNGAASSGAAVLATANAYDFSHACSSQICTGAEYITKSSATTTLLDTGVKNQTQTLYNSPQIGKPTAVKEWDYYTGSPSATPTRETDYQYTATGLDTSLVTVYDSNANPAGQTTYGYTSNATAVYGIAQHGTVNAGGPYLQSVAHWLNTTGARLTTTYAMDNTGQVTSSSDPKGNPPSGISYQCANSLPYQTTNPLNQATRYGYDCNSGAILSVQDPNDLAAGRSGTTYAYDSAGRSQNIQYPDGGQTSYGYPSSTEVDTTTIATPDPSISSQTILDAYGRKYQTAQAGASTETSYDSNGRVSCVTNPHIGSPLGTDGSTCITRYDGLSRPLVQTQPDGNTLQWSYNGNVTTSTDEASHSWVRTSDAFGRLTKVVEPTGAATNYVYDTLNNLRTVNQMGLSNETPRLARTFVYDSLSRLTSSSVPETGTITYGYDSNSNLASQTDARVVTTNYTYDALNRLTNKSSSGAGGVPGFNYQYIYDSAGGIFPTFNAIGRMVESSNLVNASQQFAYDAMGRTIWQANTLPDTCCSPTSNPISATYDLAGNTTSLTYPDGRKVNQNWDSAGHVAQIRDGNGYAYAGGFTYIPSGALTEITMGNGVYTHMPYNNRLQMCQVWVQNSQQPLMDKHYNYTSGSGFCANNSGNNGNIAQILDMRNNNRSQGFSYDALNRLSAFSNGDASMQQSYAIDSFGNLNQNGGTLQSNLWFGADNRINTPGYSQDPAGNVTLTNNGVSTGYAYDAENRLTSVSTGAAYAYSPDGSRVRKDFNGSWTEYVYFAGLPLGEKNSDGTWSDYIFANGQRIAEVDSYNRYIYFTGNFASTGNYGEETLTPASPLAGYTIRSGDKLCWKQQQTVAYGGVYFFATDGSSTGWTLTDQNGQYTNDSTQTDGAWHSRVVDLSSFAGKAVRQVELVAEGNSPPGNWSLEFADIAVVSTDGTVQPIYNGATAVSASPWGTSGFTNPSISVQSTPTATGDIHYYHGDQIGSARLLTSDAGWPISSDTFYPFGVEQTTTSDPNHYKFTGLERDPLHESNLDHAMFRQYSFGQGRWMSPDPYTGSMDINYPQTLNRYSYVLNNPLGFTDPSGLDGCSASGEATSAAMGIPCIPVGSGGSTGSAGSFVTTVVTLGLNALVDWLLKPDFKGVAGDPRGKIKPPCKTGFGAGITAGVDAGAGLVYGAGGNASVGAGLFGGDGLNGGAFASGGAGTSAFGYGASSPAANLIGRVFAGAGGGAGVGLFFTNASQASQLGGFSGTLNVDLGWLENGSGQLSFGTDSTGNNIWSFSFQLGVGGGAFFHQITNNTKTVGRKRGC